MDEHGGWLAIGSSILLWGFVLWFMLKPYMGKKEEGCCSGESCG
jgi:hypothetical protein